MPILNWLNRDKTIKESAKVPYRLLKAKDEFSYGDKDAENMIIQGDNLDGLKALLPYYAGKVKCIYIDPPYNTGSAFEHYDDNLEHTKWLEMVYPRLELLREFLREDGSIWISIDDREGTYLKVVCDEIFGRSNFVAMLPTVMNLKGNQDQFGFAGTHEYTIVYSKDKQSLFFNQFKIDEDDIEKHWEEDEIGLFKKGATLKATGEDSYRERRPKMFYPMLVDEKLNVSTITDEEYEGIYNSKLKIFDDKYIDTIKAKYENKGYCFILPVDDKNNFTRWRWGWNNNTKQKLETDVIVLKGRNGISLYKKQRPELGDVPSKKPKSLFYKPEYSSGNGTNQIKNLFGRKDFDYPKPEELIQDFLLLATNENDLILDSFLGSGTTAAVAHKMNRRYIGIEMGEHAKTHCVERLKKVVDGEQGGISKSVNWQGGGGFRFYELGEAIFDDQGKINKEIKFEHLAAHIWFSETKTPFIKKDQNNPYSPFLGIHQGVAYYLLYNGILGDKRPHGGNVLTSKILATLEEIETEKFTGEKVIYGETSRIGPAKLLSKKITFKQTPYDIKSR